MQAQVRFSNVAVAGTFTTTEIHSQTAAVLGSTLKEYKLGSLRYDLSKLRAKGLVERIPRSRRYHLLPRGYKLCVVYSKLFEKVYAPLTAGVPEPFSGDRKFPEEKTSRLGIFYLAVSTALDNPVEAVGLEAA